MKAFAYLQVSDNGQIEGDGFPRLLEAIKGYAAAHGFSIVMVYCEEGVTGALEGMSRPDLLQMTWDQAGESELRLGLRSDTE